MRLFTNNGKVLEKNKKIMTFKENKSLKNFFDIKKSCYYLFRSYKAENIDGLIKYNDTENVTDMSFMFYGCTNLQTIPLLNTSKVTNMESMFLSCSNLQTIPQLNTSKVTRMWETFAGCSSLQTIPQLNTSNVTDMGSMFRGCTNLQTIPQLNTSNVDDMYKMFYGCESLQTLPQLDTSNVTRIEGIFYSCEKIKTIDITSLDKISSASYSNEICKFCYSLTKFIIRNMETIPLLGSNAFQSCYHFYGTKFPTYNPEGLKDARIYVPDNMVESLKTATNWSAYADFIVPLSTLAE